jgi:hypothetical protein
MIISILITTDAGFGETSAHLSVEREGNRTLYTESGVSQAQVGVLT